MAKVIWTNRAIRDLRSINDFITIDSKLYATRIINRLVTRVDQLIEFPQSGRIVPEKEDATIRELIEGNYRFFISYKRVK